MTAWELSARTHSARVSLFSIARSLGVERAPLGPTVKVYSAYNCVRVALGLIVLSIFILADVACVRKTRTINDNFYVINRKTTPTKLPPVPDPVPTVASPPPSDSTSEAVETQASAGPRPKSSLSNVGILEEENSLIASLLRRVQTDPADASAHFQLGRAYHDFRLYDEALRHYQNAMRLEPENPVYYEQIGRLWRDWRSLQPGLDSVKRALELDPNFVEAWNTLGTIYDRQGNPEQAQSAYLRALSLNSNLDYIHNNLCSSYLQGGKFQQAVVHGERATQLNPTMPAAHNNLGLAYGMLGELDRALGEFKLSGDEASARNNLGLMLLARGQIAESMEQFRLATRIRPYYKEAATNYRRARDLNFQREREARIRLRFFDRETAMEAAPAVSGLLSIENAGLRFVDGPVSILSSQPSAALARKPAVEAEIEALVAHAFD